MIVLCSAAILASGCATSQCHDTAWDYKVVQTHSGGHMEQELNRLSADGWIVVSSSAMQEPSVSAPTIVVILKRHK